MKPVRDKHEWPLIATCDIEADEWVNIMCVCHMDEYGNRKAFPTREAYMDWLFTKFPGEVVWAHWGGHYDFQFLAAEAYKRNWTWQVKLSGGLMLLTKIIDGNKRRIIFADSSRLLPDSLAKIAKSIGMEKYDVDRAKLRLMSWNELQDYCMNDCRILYKALQNMRQTLTSVGCDFAYTLASICTRYVRRSGVIDWKKFYDVKNGKLVYSELMTAADNYCLPAHIGGRTEAIITGKILKRLYLYDITSSYPSAMMQPLPLYPKGFFPPSRDLENDLRKCGISDATIFIPPGTMHLPLLPLRYHCKLVFPEGHFRGRWPNIELLAFYERVKHNRRVRIQLHGQYTFEPKAFLKPFTEMFWQLRQDAIQRGDDFESYAFKIALNSVYGKLKEAIRKMEVCYGDIIAELIDKHQIGTENQTPGTTLELSGTPGIYMFGSEAEGPFRHVAAGAYITAMGRVRLYEGMERCLREGAKVYYGDTDSIITDQPVFGLKRNKQLGEFSLEAIIDNAEIFCPKVYKYEKDQVMELKPDEHRTIYKTKGMPMRLDKLSDEDTEERWQAFTQRFQSAGVVRPKPEKEGIYGFRRNIARGCIEPEAYKLPRMMQQPDTKRIHTEDSSAPLYVELTAEEWRLAKDGKLS